MQFLTTFQQRFSMLTVTAIKHEAQTAAKNKISNKMKMHIPKMFPHSAKEFGLEYVFIQCVTGLFCQLTCYNQLFVSCVCFRSEGSLLSFLCSACGARAAAHLLKGLQARCGPADRPPGCADRRHPHRSRGALPCKCPGDASWLISVT